MALDSRTLEADRWAIASTDEKGAVAESITRWLRDAGRRFQYEGLRSFRSEVPDVPEHFAPVWLDEALRMPWVFVPSGTFRPGYSPEKVASLLEQARLMSEAAMDDSQPAPTLDDLAPYGSWGGWRSTRLLQGEPVHVPPMLMAALPLLQSAPGIRDLIDVKAVRLFRFDPKAHAQLAVNPDELPRVLAAHRWRLPSTAALEWALRGGRDVLFPWGDSLPSWLHFTKEAAAEVERTIDPSARAKTKHPWEAFGDALDKLFSARFPHRYRSPDPPWDRANRFGLIDPNVVSCWCAEEERLFWVGGGAECFPWQGCCEWANFLVAGVVEHATVEKPARQVSSHALRPVIVLDA